MSIVDVEVFRLIDPPEGQEQIIRAAIEAIDFPWERLAPAIEHDRDKAVLVKWGDTGQGTSGLFYGYSYEIHLSTRNYHLDAGAAFVFAHEVGHLVDRATLDDEAREAITDLYHASDLTHRYDGHSMNGGEHPHSHNQPHAEDWVSSNDYLVRLNEAYADSFVAAFAPTVWDGSAIPGAPTRGPDWVRFVHSTRDFDAIRRLTLARDMTPEPPPKPSPTPVPVQPKETQMFKDVGPRHRHRRAIEKAVRLGLMEGKPRGYFRPGWKIKRWEQAEALVSLYERLKREQRRQQ